MLRDQESTTRETVLVQHGTLERTIVGALVAHGADPRHAGAQARMLVEGDLRGHPSHGVRRLPTLAARLDAGLLDGRADPALEWAADAVLRVDGRHGFGPVAAEAAADAIAERAETTGVALALVARSNHIGMLAPYAERLAAREQVGLVLTTSEALVHAWGGSTAMVGTNPIGIGVPSADGPVVLDMSTGSVSMGKIIDYAATGRPLPDGWAVDALGQPTSDASAAADGGAISPFGGPKGYALGLALEALVGTLTRTSFGQDVKGTLDAEHSASKGDVLLTVSLRRLGLTPMLPLLADYLDAVRASGGTRGVDVPGDRARRIRAERIERGVPLDRENWERAIELGKESVDA